MVNLPEGMEDETDEKVIDSAYTLIMIMVMYCKEQGLEPVDRLHTVINAAASFVALETKLQDMVNNHITDDVFAKIVETNTELFRVSLDSNYEMVPESFVKEVYHEYFDEDSGSETTH